MPERPLSTTSYAVLCLLAVRPWTTYELAQQMRRSVAGMWPRAESVVYEEPKRLAARGLAAGHRVATGRRQGTQWSITPAGREALRAWLDRPGAGPVTEFEGLLQVGFADAGSRDQLLATLAHLRGLAGEEEAHLAERVREYADTGGPFPDRLPVIALVVRWHALQARALREWADWAADEVAGWSGTTPATGARVAPGALSALPACHCGARGSAATAAPGAAHDREGAGAPGP